MGIGYMHRRLRDAHMCGAWLPGCAHLRLPRLLRSLLRLLRSLRRGALARLHRTLCEAGLDDCLVHVGRPVGAIRPPMPAAVVAQILAEAARLLRPLATSVLACASHRAFSRASAQLSKSLPRLTSARVSKAWHLTRQPSPSWSPRLLKSPLPATRGRTSLSPAYHSTRPSLGLPSC